MINNLVAMYKLEERWDQKCILVSLIHKGMTSDNKGWRLRDTCTLLGIAIGLCSECIMIAENLDQLSDTHSHRQAIRKLKAQGKISGSSTREQKGVHGKNY